MTRRSSHRNQKSRLMNFRSLVWAPTISLSWLWGLGFFYSIHVTLTYGWLGFLGFALPNALGLALFGWIVGRAKSPPDMIVKSFEDAYGGAILLFQFAAVAITIAASPSRSDEPMKSLTVSTRNSSVS